LPFQRTMCIRQTVGLSAFFVVRLYSSRFFFSSRRRHTRSVSAFLLNRSSDLVSSWKALNLRKTLLMASSVRLKPLNCSRLPCVYAQETLTFLLTQKKTCVKNYVQKE